MTKPISYTENNRRARIRKYGTKKLVLRQVEDVVSEINQNWHLYPAPLRMKCVELARRLALLKRNLK